MLQDPPVVELETTGCLLAQWTFGMMRLGILMAKCANGGILARGCGGVIPHIWFVRYKIRLNERRRSDAKTIGELWCVEMLISQSEHGM